MFFSKFGVHRPGKKDDFPLGKVFSALPCWLVGCLNQLKGRWVACFFLGLGRSQSWWLFFGHPPLVVLSDSITTGFFVFSFSPPRNGRFVVRGGLPFVVRSGLSGWFVQAFERRKHVGFGHHGQRSFLWLAFNQKTRQPYRWVARFLQTLAC